MVSYEEIIAQNVEQSHVQVHSESYRPLSVRLVYMPNADGGQRTPGVTAPEDKIVQGAVAECCCRSRDL